PPRDSPCRPTASASVVGLLGLPDRLADLGARGADLGGGHEAVAVGVEPLEQGRGALELAPTDLAVAVGVHRLEPREVGERTAGRRLKPRRLLPADEAVLVRVDPPEHGLWSLELFLAELAVAV